jgi:flagellar basal-body rod modification protein FlgD
MSTVNSYSGLGVSTLETSSTPKKQTLGQEQFLKLMTTQMTHQDPTKPMQNGEFLAQMAQFGTVSGIQDLQQSFKDFSDAISSGQTLQAAGLVGRYVSAPSDQGLLSIKPKDGKEVGELKGKFELPASSSSVRVKILDSEGDMVKTIYLDGTYPAGSVPFNWDGFSQNGVLQSPGVYKIQAEATIDGKNTALATDIESEVDSVSIGNGAKGIQVNLKGLSSVNFNQIKQIL